MNIRKVSALVFCTIVMMTSIVFGEAVLPFDLNVYKDGVSHADVKLIQQGLKAKGHFNDLETTEYYGKITKAAMAGYQVANGLEADGVAGKGTLSHFIASGTWPELNEKVYKLDMDHAEVPIIKAALHTEGFLTNLSLTTVYDQPTHDAVKAFQLNHNLDADGIVGQQSKDKFIALGLIDGELPVLSGQEVLEAEAKEHVMGNMGQTAYKPGLRHGDIKLLQTVLQKEGVFENEDELTDYYGDVTKEAVIAFQTKYGLEADGVVGQSTIDQMVSLGHVSHNVVVPVVSRSGGDRRYGEYLTWGEAKPLFNYRSTVVVIEDFYTGKQFNLMISYGTNHADVEPVTANDTAIVKEIWGGEFSWVRRPVLVHHNGRVLAGSMIAMPHAGIDSQPEGKTLSKRSGGYGRGYNLDSVKNNALDGVLCLHFRDSRNHAKNRLDKQHQDCVKIAAGIN